MMKSRSRNVLHAITLVIATFAVANVYAVSVRFDAPKQRLAVGETMQLHAYFVDDAGVQWGELTGDPISELFSTAEDVATVSDTGFVTALAPGKTSIVVSNNEASVDHIVRGTYEIEVFDPSDLDNDSMPDAWETQHGLDPTSDADAIADADQDGLSNADEYVRGTKPDDADTDHDSRLDGFEVEMGLDPKVAETITPPRKMNSDCVVSILNRIARVRDNGTWVLTNVPATGQQVRARATCQRHLPSYTEVGQSDFVIVPPNGQIQNVTIHFDSPVPVPGKLTLTAPAPRINAVGDMLQLTTTITYANGTTADATGFAKGTNYITSNPAIATVSEDGVVTAVAPGGVNISATNEGTLALLHLEVTGFDDSDGDGIPNDWELEHGFNPNDASDGALDADGDGLTNLAEFQHGAEPRTSDSDADGVHDGLEVQLGTNPIDPSSIDMRRALTGITMTPSSFTITMTPVLRYVTRQLRVTGTMVDGRTIDLTTSAKGTVYTSTDLGTANFETTDGKVFGGTPGSATITATNSGFTATASATIRTLDPAVSWLALPGLAKNVKVAGNYAYVANGAAGLVVVDVTDRKAPFIAATLSLPGGFANDIRLARGVAYVAAGAIGLQVVDISNPQAPALIGSLNTPGDARDVILAGLDRVYVADGPAGVRFISVANPAAPVELGFWQSNREVQGIAVSGSLLFAITGSDVRLATDGQLVSVDISTLTTPRLLGSMNLSAAASDIEMNGPYAYLATRTGGLRVVDVSNAVSMSEVARNTQFYPLDVVISGNWAYFAEELRVNGVPAVNILNPHSPFYAASLDVNRFGDADGQGLDVDERFVYLAADNELYIAQHHDSTDEDGVAPTASIVFPAAGTPMVIGDPTPVRITVADDFGIAQVITTINGVVVPDLSKPPYSSIVRIPAGTTSATIDVTVRDFGGNVGHLARTYVVGPDPGTTVVGRVVMAEGLPAAGAVLTLGTATATAGDDGRYRLDNIPTIAGNLVVKATLQDGTRVVDAQSEPVAPVRGGTTNVPDIALRAGLRVVVTPEVVAGTTLTEWQPVSIVVTAVDDAPASVNFLEVRANGRLLLELGWFAPPPYPMTVLVPPGVTSLTIVATAYDTQQNVVTSKPVVFPVVPDPGATLTGIVRNADGTPAANAQVTIRESKYDGYGPFITLDGFMEAAYEDIQTVTNANGVWTLTNVNANRGAVTVRAVQVANGIVQLSGTSAPQAVVRGQTTIVPAILLGPGSGAIAKLSFDWFGSTIAIRENRMIVGSGAAAHFFDVSDPTRPRLRGTLRNPDKFRTIASANWNDDGTKAILLNSFGTLYVVDATDLTRPTLLGQVAFSGGVTSAVTRGSLTIITSSDLIFVDTSNPAAPVILSRFALPQRPVHIALSGNYAVVTEGTGNFGPASGIDVVDISDPVHPKLTGRVALPDTMGSFGIIGTRAYFPDNNEINLFDFTDPASPVLTRNVTPLSPLVTYAIANSGNRLLISGESSPGRFAMADASTSPAAPVYIGDISVPEASQYRISILGAGPSYVGAIGTVRFGMGTPFHIGATVWLVQPPPVVTP